MNKTNKAIYNILESYDLETIITNDTIRNKLNVLNHNARYYLRCYWYMLKDWNLPEHLALKIMNTANTRNIVRFITYFDLKYLELYGPDSLEMGGAHPYSNEILKLYSLLKRSYISKMFGANPEHPITFDTQKLLKELRPNYTGGNNWVVPIIKLLVKLKVRQRKRRRKPLDKTRYYTSIRSITIEDIFELLDQDFTDEEKAAIYNHALNIRTVHSD